MKTLAETVFEIGNLSKFTNLLPSGHGAWLVGGAIRSLLAGETVNDFDIVLRDDPSEVARAFAKAIGGSWFLLDKSRKQSRIVLKGDEGNIVYDFAPFRAPELFDDLYLRDFTVNALALDLVSKELHDPLGGGEDLKSGIIRVCSPYSFIDDPLRMLKGIRHAVQNGFRFEAQTEKLMVETSPLLSNVSPERIRAELALIFNHPKCLIGMENLERIGLLTSILGKNDKDAFTDGVSNLCTFNGFLSEQQEGGVLKDELEAEFRDGFTRSGFLRCASFLSAYRHHLDDQWFMERLRTSKALSATFGYLMGIEPQSIVSSAKQLDCSKRGRALWVESLGPSPLDTLLYAAAIVRVDCEVINMFRAFFSEYREVLHDGRIPDLVAGGWLLRQKPHLDGRLVGSALGQLREAEMNGVVFSEEEGKDYLLKIIDTF